MADKVTQKEQLLDDKQAKQIVATFFQAAARLAAVTDLSEPIDFDDLEVNGGGKAVDRLGQMIDEVQSKANEVATTVCDKRRDNAGANDAAIKDASQDRDEVELPDNESPSVSGRVVHEKTREPVGGLQVTARTKEREVVGVNVTDASGAFAIELNEHRPDQLQLEVTDPSGAPVAVKNVKLSPKTPTATFVTIPVAVAVGKEEEGAEVGEVGEAGELGEVERPTGEIEPPSKGQVKTGGRTIIVTSGNRGALRRRAAG